MPGQFGAREELLMGQYFQEEHRSDLFCVRHTLPPKNGPSYRRTARQLDSSGLTFCFEKSGVTTGGQRIHYGNHSQRWRSRGMDRGIWLPVWIFMRHAAAPAALGVRPWNLAARLLDKQNVREASTVPKGCDQEGWGHGDRLRGAGNHVALTGDWQRQSSMGIWPRSWNFPRGEKGGGFQKDMGRDASYESVK